ncbi:DUF1059 domain-containing protein [Halomarina ordinaria]|uniref:DUF1059 domain-containing protein n=1 Tax=Halomarina ordinaria TaxID=3033939 RepID=A0ABD5UDZ1_9EURY|nr:DUF1059 domain-containing protein [Halomarina sp. PSRA2]
MAYQFDCAVDGCSFTAQGATESEVLNSIEDHTQREHPETDLDAQRVRNGIRTV